MREKAIVPETVIEAQLFMFADAPIVPVQGTIPLPDPEPVEAELDPHPDLFLWYPPAAVAAPLMIYLHVGEEPSGPYAEQDIVTKLKDGSLSPETYAWHAELEDWQRLSDLIPQASILPPAHLASFPVRFAAGCIDLAIIIVAYFILMIAVPPFRDGIEASSLSTQGLIISNVVLSVAIYPYFLLFLGPSGKGRTPGYRVLHIRLVDQATRQALNWVQALLWCAGSILMVVGWPLYWLDPSRRMLHNRVSRTIVVNDLP